MEGNLHRIEPFRANLSLVWTDNGNPEAEATLQRQRGLVLPNAEVFSNVGLAGGPICLLVTVNTWQNIRNNL